MGIQGLGTSKIGNANKLNEYDFFDREETSSVLTPYYCLRSTSKALRVNIMLMTAASWNADKLYGLQKCHLMNQIGVSEKTQNFLCHTSPTPIAPKLVSVFSTENLGGHSEPRCPGIGGGGYIYLGTCTHVRMYYRFRMLASLIGVYT